MKALIAVAPDGSFGYVSDCFGGKIRYAHHLGPKNVNFEKSDETPSHFVALDI